MVTLFNNNTLAIISIVFWAIVIVLSLIVEAQTSDLVSVWFGVGAIPSLVCAVFEVHISIQILLFAIISGLLVLITRPLVKNFNRKNTIPTNSDRLIGMIATVIEAIPCDGKGKVKIEFQEWSAISATHSLIEAGTQVVVKEIRGNKLVVEIVTDSEIK